MGKQLKSDILYENYVAAVAEWSGYRIVAGLVTSSSPGPLKTDRVGARCMLNLSRAQTSSQNKPTFENRRNSSCNHAYLPHRLNQSGDSYPSKPVHIRPHLTFSIWDGGTFLVPFPRDGQRPENKQH
ncbi:hypothetical protein TNCV_1217771 [Trichonephila clavipes]|nr:hypothetical protein TNCV_1217771 [Trichonephila clavipes]